MRITETVPFTTIDLNAIVGQYFQQWMIFFWHKVLKMFLVWKKVQLILWCCCCQRYNNTNKQQRVAFWGFMHQMTCLCWLFLWNLGGKCLLDSYSRAHKIKSRVLCSLSLKLWFFITCLWTSWFYSAFFF